MLFAGREVRIEKTVPEVLRTTRSISSSGIKGLCGKRIIGYNFGRDDNTETKFGTHKELSVLNILKYKSYVNKSRDMSLDHFAKKRKLLTNWWPV